MNVLYRLFSWFYSRFHLWNNPFFERIYFSLFYDDSDTEEDWDYYVVDDFEYGYPDYNYDPYEEHYANEDDWREVYDPYENSDETGEDYMDGEE